MGNQESNKIKENNSKLEVNIEELIDNWESENEISSKYFLNLIFNINSKILKSQKSMSNEKFESYFLNNFAYKYTRNIFEHSFFNDEVDKMDINKIKNLYFLISLPTKTTTYKGFYYDKANYIYSIVKEYDNDFQAKITIDSIGIKYFIHDLIYISVVVIPNIFINIHKKYQDTKNKLFILNDHLEDVCNLFLKELFKDKIEIGLNDLNDIYNNETDFLTSKYIRKFALNSLIIN